MIYTKHQFMSSSLTAADARLSYIGLFDIIEDALTECMGKLHLDGVTVRRLYNAMWVFTKNKVRLFDRPRWGEEMLIESFVSAVSPAKMVVDTLLKYENGDPVAYSSCEMCVLDADTYRIRRTSSVGVDGSVVAEPARYEVLFDKIDDADLPQTDTVTVRSTNIDFSRHCNNVEYLRFLFNTYTAEQLTELAVKEIEVCYVAQSFEGDELTVHKLTAPERDILSVKKNGATVIKCHIVH